MSVSIQQTIIGVIEALFTLSVTGQTDLTSGGETSIKFVIPGAYGLFHEGDYVTFVGTDAYESTNWLISSISDEPITGDEVVVSPFDASVLFSSDATFTSATACCIRTKDNPFYDSFPKSEFPIVVVDIAGTEWISGSGGEVADGDTNYPVTIIDAREPIADRRQAIDDIKDVIRGAFQIQGQTYDRDAFYWGASKVSIGFFSIYHNQNIPVVIT